ncbi:MAG: NmrA/HSCARG family protein [Gammaproteobacteria bacterium]
MPKKPTILVTGATGNQGGHVARLLLRKEYHVVAMTRSKESPAAKNLQSLGAKLVVGDLTDRASLEKAIHGVDAIFGMTTFKEGGVEVEVQQGINLVEVAHKANLRLIFSSVASANKETGVPHFNSKWEIEKHILQSRIEYTIIGPVYFMENLLTFGLEGLKSGIYASPLKPETRLAQVCLDDLANFVFLILENRAKFIRKRIDIASDVLTGAQVVEVLSKALNEEIKYVQTPIEKVREQSKDIATMYEWFEKVGFDVDIDALHRQYPEVHWHTFEQWVKQRNLGYRIHPPRKEYHNQQQE